MANRLPILIDGYGKKIVNQLSSSGIEWKSGWYLNVKDITTGTTDASFTITYLTGNVLYDRFTSPIAGGAVDAAAAMSTNTFVCPYKASGAVNWADVETFPVEQLRNANLIRARKLSREPFTKTDLDGYNHEMYLLYGFTASGPGSNPTHYMYWCYFDMTGTIVQMSNGDASLPGAAETIDIWVPVTTNVDIVPWSAGLVQDCDIFPLAGNVAVNTEPYKTSYTIDGTATKYDGTTAFGTIDLSKLHGSSLVIWGFLNGIELNCSVKALGAAASTDDVIFDTGSAGYPGTTDIYWNGTARGSSSLGNIDLNDVLRFYFIKEL